LAIPAQVVLVTQDLGADSIRGLVVVFILGQAAVSIQVQVEDFIPDLVAVCILGPVEGFIPDQVVAFILGQVVASTQDRQVMITIPIRGHGVPVLLEQPKMNGFKKIALIVKVSDIKRYAFAYHSGRCLTCALNKEPM
jgi:hypothetical protein